MIPLSSLNRARRAARRRALGAPRFPARTRRPAITPPTLLARALPPDRARSARRPLRPLPLRSNRPNAALDAGADRRRPSTSSSSPGRATPFARCARAPAARTSPLAPPRIRKPGEFKVLGLSGAPQAGEKFKVFAAEADAKELANKRAQIERETGIRTKKHITLDEIGRRLALGNFKELNLIIKGDVDGSVEALADSLLKLSTEEIQIRIIHKGVGAISESDVLLATASDAIVIGFNVRPSMNAKKIADTEGVDIRLYSIIYNAIEEIKSAMEGLLEPKIEEKVIGNLDVKDVINVSKVGVIAGCFVRDGRILNKSKVRVIRDGIVIHTGTVGSLKRFKDDAKEVVSGLDCGVQVKDYQDIKTGDTLEVFEEIEVQRKL